MLSYCCALEGQEETKWSQLFKLIITQLDKESKTGIRRIGTSCSDIANLGNLESGNFLLDTDAEGKHAPYEVKLV